VRGAFTGAEQSRPGKLEVADKGTLLLDEIGELPLSIQPKLLRALQEGEVQRVGADRSLRVDVRVVAATNRDIEREVAEGRFRADLFHRLNVYRLAVPPLRERRSDIPLLAGHFCDEARARLGVGPVRLTKAARELLAGGAWPGNVRELENTVFRMVLQASRGVPRGAPVVVKPAHLGVDVAAAPEPAPREDDAEKAAPAAAGPLNEQVDAFQRGLIERAVAQADGNWAAAARSLGMHRSNLHHLAKRLGLR
jgi:anaerobic nitric oxide reductase transcription regulator